MSTDRKNQGPRVAHSFPLAAGTLQQPADAGLSAAFRHVLGTKPGEAHLPAPALKPGQEIARLARSDKPAAAGKGTPRKAHIGPRSGHK